MPHEASEVDRRRQEFRDFVWNHSEDEFQAKFDKCPPLNENEIGALQRILDPSILRDEDLIAREIEAVVKEDKKCLLRMLQIVGLTRNKIVQDIKAHARVNALKIPTSTPSALFGKPEGSRLASRYLAQKYRSAFGHLKAKPDAATLDAMSRITWPGYIRQQRAKESGHYAEQKLAMLLQACGLSFAPEAKLEDGKTPDIIIDDMSYDLVSPSAADAQLRIVATVHTSNIGQYGESKDDLEIKKAIESMLGAGDRDQVTLLAFIDGVGFESNAAGLTGVLTNADEFCQFRTIWKAACIAALKTGRTTRVALNAAHHERFRRFAEAFSVELVDIADLDADPEDWVEAGDGFIQMA